MTDFKQKLIALSDNYSSPKLENTKQILIDAASAGKRKAIIRKDGYDKTVVEWLKHQKLSVEETLDPRDGDFISVYW